jgi:hypothetical protein
VDTQRLTSHLPSIENMVVRTRKSSTKHSLSTSERTNDIDNSAFYCIVSNLVIFHLRNYFGGNIWDALCR